ncbi:MAG TPA: SIR2 family protein [Solirubrobacterales bacterium]
MILAGTASETKGMVKRLEEAADLPEPFWERAGRLACQLDDSPVIPLVGAGTSIDCGHAKASEVSKVMCGDYESRHGPRLPSDLKGKSEDMGVVADALFTAGGQESVIEALGLRDPVVWPDQAKLSDHFCAYRVLARLAREDFFSEAISLNYDCAFERGLDDEGFLFAPRTGPRGAWLNRATVVPDGPAHVKLEKRGELVLTKAHGCAATFRRDMDKNPDRKRKEMIEEAIIVRRGQLLDWRTDFWARDLFADRTRRHVILMLGISGQDPVIHIAMTRVLQEVYRQLGPIETCDEPRVVVIDRDPDTVALQALIHQGAGCSQLGPDVVTSLKVPEDSSMTAVMIALATQMLALRLKKEGGTLVPNDRVYRLVSLMAAAPASLRWAFRLERRSRGLEFHQRTMLEEVGAKGYVPLAVGAGRAAESLRVRDQIRNFLELPNETVAEAVDNHGFIASWKRGCAFLPLGVTAVELDAMPSAAIQQVALDLPKPKDLEHVLVAADGSHLIGRSVQTGSRINLE